ncbi:MAG: hypothetical protein KDK05_06685 [Candidatus Competibacteraceae bacterium]|nr:hypothetical protein [Candidatus Competibacteraceae bacterium]
MNYQNPKSDMAEGPSSGLSAGVKDGLSEVMTINELDTGQRTKGPDQKPMATSGSAGSRNGKSFKWK